MKRMERRCALIALLLLAGLAVLPTVSAAAEPTLWTMRGRALVSDYENRFKSSYFENRTELDVDQGRGLEFAIELRPNSHVGVELSVGRMSFDADLRNIRTEHDPSSSNPRDFRDVVTFSDEGDFVMEPISLSVLFHVLRDRPLDFYLGPQAAWVRYDVGVEAQDREAELAYGAKLGAELRLGGSPWSLGLELRHIETIHESQDRDLYGSIGLNAAALSLGYHIGPPARR
jgi:hypothetical protein